MNLKFTFLITIAIFTIFLTACPSSDNPLTSNISNTNNTNLANTNQTVANVNSPFNTTKTPEAATTNNAPTLAPIVAAYYDALKKKDDAAIKKVMSAEFIKTMETDMKDAGKTGLAAFMAETDTIPTKPIEVRNEKIEGDKATAELKGGVNANWTAYGFRKEAGTWKMTNEFPDVQTVNQSVNSNKAK